MKRKLIWISSMGLAGMSVKARLRQGRKARKKMNRKLILMSSMGLAGMGANAQLRQGQQHFVVPAEQVARVIVASFAERGMVVSADKVKLPVDVLAAEANPALEVSSIQPLGRLSATHREEKSAGVRLRCKTAAACLPFYAVVTWQEDESSPSPGYKLAAQTARVAELRPSALVKAGARLTFIMEADHARILMEVISLGNAALGQQVHVSTPDRKHSYLAEVLSEHTVKGTF